MEAKVNKKKKELLLFLSQANSFENAVIAPTLAWIAHSKNHLFDSYYSGYHTGIHYGGGIESTEGDLLGGTVSGGRHFEHFYLLLQSFKVSVASFGASLFQCAVDNLDIPMVCRTDRLSELYKQIFTYLNLSVPTLAVMIGKIDTHGLTGIENYFYPEIYFRCAIGLIDSLADNELADILPKGCRVLTLFVKKEKITKLKELGYQVSEIEPFDLNNDYLSILKRIAQRWGERAKGWILGDPRLIIHWLPKACEERLLPLYSIPQEKILKELEPVISLKGNVVFGRQFDDSDFFTLSRMNKAFQVIDPCRPPFQSLRHMEYVWEQEFEGFDQEEPSEAQLEQYAEEGKILISLMFWTGMIRELENLYNLVELIALTKMKCGLVLTSQSFEYMMHYPMEAITIPLERGGIYPLAEPVMGSCGLGVGIESEFTLSSLEADLSLGIQRIHERVKNRAYMPKGWWTTLDTDLEKLPLWRRPKIFRLSRALPYIQIRHNKSNSIEGRNGEGRNSAGSFFLRNEIKKRMYSKNLQKYFLPYRPYESYKPAEFDEKMVSVAKKAGLKYMLSKSGFGGTPKIHYIDDEFIALNYTAGQWDGWTPFVTVNNIYDLKKVEKRMLKRNRPGWITSTVDSCLWTFSGPVWERGSKLCEIAVYCARGGDSRKLLNVHPYTIARYARILFKKGL